MAKVLVAMGSKSDLDAVKPAVSILKRFGVDVTVKVMSAHRTPDVVKSYASGEAGDFDVFIAAAGKAAHLAGFIAAFTTRPVIGLPVKSSTMDGMDSLLSTVQMPPGVPVATVAINGGLNAGLLALQMLAIPDVKLQKELKAYRAQAAQDVINSNTNLSEEL